jgi:hypothetical protein
MLTEAKAGEETTMLQNKLLYNLYRSLSAVGLLNKFRDGLCV